MRPLASWQNPETRAGARLHDTRDGLLGQIASRSEISVKASVLNRLGDVLGAELLVAFEVGHGAREALGLNLSLARIRGMAARTCVRTTVERERVFHYVPPDSAVSLGVVSRVRINQSWGENAGGSQVFPDSPSLCSSQTPSRLALSAMPNSMVGSSSASDGSPEGKRRL